MLRSATGDSRFVVVVFLDVRGFSSFARMAESSESAVFLKSAYTAILDDYFQTASFFKPTGDGLLILLDYDDGSLQDVVGGAVRTSVHLVEAFSTICDKDPMVNFDVPTELGIGLARGAATRLRSGNVTLDYSGRPLNLAGRLMDIARPSGVVFSDSLGPDLLEPELVARFAAEDVYVKGLAEDFPMKVHYLADRTVVTDVYKRPLHKTRIHAEPMRTYPLAQLATMGNFRFALSGDPLDRSQVRLVVHHHLPTPSGVRRKGIEFTTRIGTTYAEDAEGPHVRADLVGLSRTLARRGVKRTWPCRMRIEYVVVA